MKLDSGCKTLNGDGCIPQFCSRRSSLFNRQKFDATIENEKNFPQRIYFIPFFYSYFRIGISVTNTTLINDRELKKRWLGQESEFGRH